MKNQESNETNTDVKVAQNVQQKTESTSVEKTERNETVAATQFDPKEAKHGVDFCCGSCGG